MSNDTEQKNALNYATGKTWNYSVAYPYSSIIATIDGGRPLVAKLTWKSNTANWHVVVFSGYDSGSSKVRILNPEPVGSGTTTDCSYSSLVSGMAVPGSGSTILFYNGRYYYS